MADFMIYRIEADGSTCNKSIGTISAYNWQEAFRRASATYGPSIYLGYYVQKLNLNRAVSYNKVTRK